MNEMKEIAEKLCRGDKAGVVLAGNLRVIIQTLNLTRPIYNEAQQAVIDHVVLELKTALRTYDEVE